MSPLDTRVLLQHLRDDVEAFGRCLDGDLAASVGACPGWDVRALAVHLGRTHRWATAALGSPDEPPYPPRPDEQPLAAWFGEGAERLIRELGERPPDQPCWSLWPPRSVQFWVRRQALETLVHRLDAEAAQGAMGPIDEALARDGVAEVVEVMYPRQVAMGRQAPLRSRLVLRTSAAEWPLGTGATAVLTAPAPALLLLLWKRVTLEQVLADGGRLDGDRTVADDVLAATLTP